MTAQPDWAVRPAYGPPLARASLRASPEAFQVEEVLGFEPAGEGEHLLVHIQKRGLTTQQAAQRLARAWGVRARNVGWAGLKDKHALTRQTLSLPWPIKRELPVPDEIEDGLQVLAVNRHNRKLRAGSHTANHFKIDCQLDSDIDADALQARVADIQAGGMPNGFGAQRFGRDGDNVEQFMAATMDARCPGILMSAARSVVFNAVLDKRIAEGRWASAVAGDWMMLDGTRSGFVASADDEALPARLASLDVHVSGPMPGSGEPQVHDQAAALEGEIEHEYAEIIDRLKARGVVSDRRALRVRVGELMAEPVSSQAVRLCFTLPPGSFATTLIDQFFTQIAV